MAVEVAVGVAVDVGVGVPPQGKQPQAGSHIPEHGVSWRTHAPDTHDHDVQALLAGQSATVLQPGVGLFVAVEVAVGVAVGVGLGVPPQGSQPQAGLHIPEQGVSERTQFPSVHAQDVQASLAGH